MSAGRGHQTGHHRHAVQQDGTGAADAMLAADVGPGQAQLVAQEVAQQQPWFDGALEAAAVHLNFDLDPVDDVGAHGRQLYRWRPAWWCVSPP